MSTKVAPVRGRPRSEASRGAILAAANELLRTIGLNRMSIEAVAEASGVGKTTIYRWWPSKGTLALDAYLEDMRAKVVVPDTGDGGQDLRRHARAVIDFYAGKEGRIFAQFIDDVPQQLRRIIRLQKLRQRIDFERRRPKRDERRISARGTPPRATTTAEQRRTPTPGRP